MKRFPFLISANAILVQFLSNKGAAMTNNKSFKIDSIEVLVAPHGVVVRDLKSDRSVSLTPDQFKDLVLLKTVIDLYVDGLIK